MTKPEQGPEPATPLPWEYAGGNVGVYYNPDPEPGEDDVVYFVRGPVHLEGWTREKACQDAAYMYHACNNYPAAQARIAELEAAAQSVLDCAADGVWGERFETCDDDCECCLCDVRKALAAQTPDPEGQ